MDALWAFRLSRFSFPGAFAKEGPNFPDMAAKFPFPLHRCAAQLRAYRELQQAMPAAQLCFTAPTGLRRRIETALPAARPRTSSRLLCGSMPTKSRMRSVGIEPLAGPSAAAGLSVICETCPNDPANGGIAIGH
jgi:hypothetical protein